MALTRGRTPSWVMALVILAGLRGVLVLLTIEPVKDPAPNSIGAEPTIDALRRDDRAIWPALAFQATGRSPSCGVRLSSFDDGVSRSRVASEAQSIVVCGCVRTSLWYAGRLGLRLYAFILYRWYYHTRPHDRGTRAKTVSHSHSTFGPYFSPRIANARGRNLGENL
jgi:hypothetical protein